MALQPEDMERIIGNRHLSRHKKSDLKIFRKIANRISNPDRKHPDGVSLHVLLGEVEGVRRAYDDPDSNNLVAEIYDVVDVCVRLLRQLEI